MRDRGDCLIGFVDGIGRVLSPVAVGEKDCTSVWGRFLRYYGDVNVEVEVGLGR
jgi:hypothetical protein